MTGAETAGTDGDSGSGSSGVSGTEPEPRDSGAHRACEGAVEAVEESNGSWLCRPAHGSRCPGVLYNHGGVGDAVGGDLEGTCRALAGAGYVAYAKRRGTDPDFQPNVQDAEAGLEALVADAQVDPLRLAMVGFSRGVAITFCLAEDREGLAALVLLGAGAGSLMPCDVVDYAADLPPIQMLAVENDLQSPLEDMVADVKNRLEAEGAQVVFVVYPPYPHDPDGHQMFWEVGAYFDDVLDFLDVQL